MLAPTRPQAGPLLWTAALDTGIEDVDQQHRRLFEIFNRVAVTRDRAELGAVLRELTDYSVYHFDTETRLMEQWPLRAEHREAHRRAHQRFGCFLRRAAAVLEVEPDAVGDELTGFLVQWLQHHIMGMDRRMADDIRALSEGRELAHASTADALDAMLDGLGDRTFDLLEANRRLRDEVAFRHEIEATLRDSEERYRDLFTHSPDALFVIDARQCIALVNRAALLLLGADDAQALRGRPISRFVASVRGLDAIETRARRIDGGALAVEVVAGPPDRGGHRHLIVRDIGERRRLQRRVVEATRVEQERVGRELHDGTGQRLVAIGLFANTLQRRLQEQGCVAEAGMMTDLGQHVRQTLDEVRRLAHGVAPLRLAGGGLPGALQALCADLGCHCSCAATAGAVDGDVALQFYRIAQEALSNALRHAGARHIDLALRDDGDVLALCVRDDGCGLAADGAEGLGMSTMRYRAGSIGAALGIAAGEGGGTEVTCSWPRGF